jgi:hypothetical protein
MKRRSFFKAVAAAAAAVCIPTTAAAAPVASSAAISIPFAKLPRNCYIRGPRYRVMFDRVVLPRFTEPQLFEQVK